VRAILMGGGTAGHLFPSVAVAQRLVADTGAEVLFIGAEGRLDSKILTEHHLPHRLIPARPFPYGMSLKSLAALWALWQSARRCLPILREFKPDVVFGAGGYVSVAGVLAASQLHIPTVCHASDAHPDRANRLLARWATRITTHYEVAAAQFPPEKTTVTGQPVRREFLETTSEAARAQLGIAPEAFVLLVSGGSQGARTLNYATVEALPRLLELPNVQVLHLTGSLDYEDIAHKASETVGDNPRYRCLAFHEEPWVPIAAADLALTRGGASSLAEMSVLGLPMLIVPYPYAAAHQKLNAAPLVERGAALVVDNADLTAQWLLDRVSELQTDRAKLLGMRDAARSASQPDAAGRIAAILEEAAKAKPKS